MNTTQLKITLPNTLKDLLKNKSNIYGLTMSSYIKNLIINDVKENDYPMMNASRKIEKSYKKALRNESKATVVKNVEELDDFFDNL